MNFEQAVPILRKITFFEGIDDKGLQVIYSCAKTVDIRQEGFIFSQGDPGDGMYLIIAGKVEISQRDPMGYRTVLATLGPSSVIGDMAVLDDLPRSASAQAVERTIMLYIPRDDFQLLLEFNFSLTLKILNTLSKRLREANEKVVDKRRKMF